MYQVLGAEQRNIWVCYIIFARQAVNERLREIPNNTFRRFEIMKSDDWPGIDDVNQILFAEP